MTRKAVIPKIILLYIICFVYIWLNNVLKISIAQDRLVLIYVLNNAAKLAFYMATIILSYFISRDERSKMVDIILLFIPAVIFIASAFILAVPNMVIGGVLRDLALYSSIFLFAGVSILCSLIFRYVSRRKAE